MNRKRKLPPDSVGLIVGSDATSARVPRLQIELSARMLTVALGLALWIATGSLVLAVAEGLGEQPGRRLLVGVALILVIATGLWQRHALCVALRARPWLVLPMAAGVVAIVAIDGLTDGGQVGPFTVVTVTPIGLAAVVAGPPLTWACITLLEACFVAFVAIAMGHDALDDGSLASLLGASLAYPFAALVCLGLARVFIRFVSNADAIVDDIGRGAPMLTPALAGIVALRAGAPTHLLGAPAPFAELTPREIQVIEALARGQRPKQIARAWGVALPTVRTHINNAKRKTGARTQASLSALPSDPRWPRTLDDERDERDER